MGWKKIITYANNEGSNLNTMIITLKSIVKSKILSLEESFEGICFGCVFSKACHYATTNKKVYNFFIFVPIKSR
jgi:hypothetical protein